MSTPAPSSASTIAATALDTGQCVQFAETGDVWWTVRAVSDDHHFVILTTPIPEEDNNTNDFPDETEASVYYTIIDNERGVRGPDNVWGNGYDTDEQIARSLQDLLDEEIAVSRRPSNWENIHIAAVLPPEDVSTTGSALDATEILARSAAGKRPHWSNTEIAVGDCVVTVAECDRLPTGTIVGFAHPIYQIPMSAVRIEIADGTKHWEWTGRQGLASTAEIKGATRHAPFIVLALPGHVAA